MFARYKDIISGSFLLAFAIFFYIGSLFIQNLTGAKIGPAFVPQLVSIVVAALSISVIMNGVKKLKPEENLSGNKEMQQADMKKKPAYSNAVILSIISMAIYFGFMNSIGFIIMTFLYLSAQIYIISNPGQRRKKFPLYILVGAVCSVTIYMIFVKIFDLMLPAGILG